MDQERDKRESLLPTPSATPAPPIGAKDGEDTQTEVVPWVFVEGVDDDTLIGNAPGFRILRDYIITKYGIDETYRKSEEFLGLILDNSDISDQDKKQLGVIFQNINEMKYGGTIPYREEIDEFKKRIFNFIKSKK